MEQYLLLAKKIARGSGEILIKEYGKSTVVDIIDKDHKGIITNADIPSDKYIRETIISTYPEHSLLSEESRSRQVVQKEPHDWVIDPLDGIINYRRSNPDFAVSIAMRKKKKFWLE